MEPEAWEWFTRWVRSRPPSVQQLARRFPPLCAVKTRPGVILLIPAPGIEGVVNSYYEDGCLGVAAPTSIPHPEYDWGRDPETGEELPPGTVGKAHVPADLLELVRYGEITAADVDKALSV